MTDATGDAVAAAMAAIAPDAANLTELSAEERQRWAAALPDIAGTWAAAADEAGLAGTEVLEAYVQALQEAGADLGRDWTMR